MKKSLLCEAVAVALLFVILSCVRGGKEVLVNGVTGEERYNDRLNLNAVRAVSQIEGVYEAAVLSRSGNVLAGLRVGCTDVYSSELVAAKAREVLREFFPGAKNIRVAVEDDRAPDIIELSYFLETNMDRRILIKRFEFLFEKATEA